MCTYIPLHHYWCFVWYQWTHPLPLYRMILMYAFQCTVWPCCKLSDVLYDPVVRRSVYSTVWPCPVCFLWPCYTLSSVLDDLAVRCPGYCMTLLYAVQGTCMLSSVLYDPVVRCPVYCMTLLYAVQCTVRGRCTWAARSPPLRRWGLPAPPGRSRTWEPRRNHAVWIITNQTSGQQEFILS